MLADGLVRYAAGNAVVITVAYFAHQVIVFVLYGAGVDGHFGAELLETFRQFGAPQDGQVRFGRGAEVVQRLQEAEGSFGHFHTSVVEAAADGFGHPGGVACKYIVIRLHTQVADHTQLDDKLVDQFLRKGFVNLAMSQVVFDKDIEERGNVTQ